MRLRDVSRHFNRTACLDAYSGVQAFYAQVLPYDEVKRDAVTYERRIMSVDPDVVVPARRVVTAMGRRWILGTANPDQFLGSDIRHGYVAHEANTLATLTTPGKMVNGAAGTSAYAARAWVKNSAFSQQSSDLAVQYDVFLSSSEMVGEGDIVVYQGEPLIVRAVHPGETGITKALCEGLASSLVSGVIEWGTWNALTETLAGGTYTGSVLSMRWQAMFAYGDSTSPKFEAGDVQLAFSSSVVATPVGARITLANGTKWLVKDATALPDSAWLCRASRNG